MLIVFSLCEFLNGLFSFRLHFSDYVPEVVHKNIMSHHGSDVRVVAHEGLEVALSDRKAVNIGKAGVDVLGAFVLEDVVGAYNELVFVLLAEPLLLVQFIPNAHRSFVNKYDLQHLLQLVQNVHMLFFESRL